MENSIFSRSVKLKPQREKERERETSWNLLNRKAIVKWICKSKKQSFWFSELNSEMDCKVNEECVFSVTPFMVACLCLGATENVYCVDFRVVTSTISLTSQFISLFHISMPWPKTCLWSVPWFVTSKLIRRNNLKNTFNKKRIKYYFDT